MCVTDATAPEAVGYRGAAMSSSRSRVDAAWTSATNASNRRPGGSPLR